MKNIIITLCLLISFSAYSQIKKTKILEEKIGTINLTYFKSFDLDKNQTSYYCGLYFQNAKYTSITDLKFIHFYKKEDLEAFTSDLNKIYAEMNDKVDISFDRDNYNLSLHDFSPNLYINTVKGVAGYNVLGKKLVKNLIDSLARVDFGNDTLK